MRAVLLIETSTDAASIALAIDGRLADERSFVSDRRHNSLLFGPLAELIEAHGRRSFEAVLVGSGPGSYSGTRVGIATAQGAALVAGCKAVAVPSILATPAATSGESCFAFGDARRGSYWISRIEGGHLLSLPELTDETGLDFALGRAWESGTTCFSIEPVARKAIPLQRPTAAGLWEAWQTASPQTRAQWAGQIPQPIYLKPPHVTESKNKEVFG